MKLNTVSDGSGKSFSRSHLSIVANQHKHIVMWRDFHSGAQILCTKRTTLVC